VPKFVSDNPEASKPPEADGHSDRETRLHQWFQSYLGKRLVAEQTRCVTDIMKAKFGQHLIQLDSGLQDPLIQKPPVGCMSLMSRDDNRAACPVIRGVPEHLPLRPEAIDHVLLHHTLDYCEDPYQALRESEQVLVSGGYVIVVGFSPFSFWGIRRLLQWNAKRTQPWNGRFLSVNRVQDWLNVLGLEVQSHYTLAHWLPVSSPVLADKLGWFNTLIAWMLPQQGGCYVLVAQKRTPGMTLTGSKWRKISARPPIQRANIRNES